MQSGAINHYQRYRAPRENDTALVAPPLDSLHITPPCPDKRISFGSRSLAQLRSDARAELLEAATRYTSAYRDPSSNVVPDAPLLITGHQAELFHPGVWYKNFMLSRLASERRGVGVHLVIDTDAIHGSGIRVPTGSVAEPHIETVLMDRPAGGLPVEQRQVQDLELFRSFGKRAVEAIAPLVPQPLIGAWWSRVTRALKRVDGTLGLAIAQARHELEADWGAATLELPMSVCCEFDSFRALAASLLMQANQLQAAYNASLAAYRQAHGLRNVAQPMPNLETDGDWLETPFWVWSTDLPERRALYVRRTLGELQLTNRQGWRTTIQQGNSHEAVVEQLTQIAKQGWKLRTRALTTTLFARMILGDLFLHGIGGAKYDEVTDDLSRRLWGCSPPDYLTLSATLQLPIEHPRVRQEELRETQQAIRNCRWSPETLLDSKYASCAAVLSKRRWIDTPITPANARQRHQAIEAANAEIRPLIAPIQSRLESRLEKLEAQHRATNLLESREYAFCLFPAESLRERMQHLVDNP